MKKLLLLITALFIGVSAASTLSIADESSASTLPTADNSSALSEQEIQATLEELMDKENLSLEEAAAKLLKDGVDSQMLLAAALQISPSFDFAAVLSATAAGDSDNSSDNGDSQGEGTSAPSLGGAGGGGGGGGGGAVSN
jgi:hypothetical protein